MDETSSWLAKAAIAELITRYAALNDAGDVANVLVTLESETEARASSQILLFTSGTEGRGTPVLTTAPLIGTYRDRLTRTNPGWRFLERRGSLDFRTAIGCQA